VKVLGLTEKLQNCKFYNLHSSLNIPYDGQFEKECWREIKILFGTSVGKSGQRRR
jgi:hypothetical protein